MTLELHSIHPKKLWIIVALVLFVTIPLGAARATETITYTYDARGRVIKVERTGTVNNNVNADYTHDKVDNRTNVTVTGSPN
ncbi:hypothetical protein [Blastomonas sp.]|uniref:hypothetical protein n=1 Tax=Blastomonas sp. TaxID=1909299 RepID=UPI00391A3284